MGNHTQNFPKVVSGQDAQDMHGLQPEPHRLIEMRNIVKSFNIGDQGELTIITAATLTWTAANSSPWLVPPAPASPR